MSEKHALYEISYLNAIMYSRAMPMPYDENEDDKPLFDETKDACDPSNFDNENFEDEIVVRA